jgi:hypothetical protein
MRMEPRRVKKSTLPVSISLKWFVEPFLALGARLVLVCTHLEKHAFLQFRLSSAKLTYWRAMGQPQSSKNALVTRQCHAHTCSKLYAIDSHGWPGGSVLSGFECAPKPQSDGFILFDTVPVC